MVGMIHSDIWGQLAKSWVRWAGAGATSAFFLGTWSSGRWLRSPCLCEAQGLPSVRQGSFLGFGVMKFVGWVLSLPLTTCVTLSKL